MEKVNYCVMTRRDKKKLDEIKRLFSLIGFDFESIVELKSQNDALRTELIKYKEENAHMRDELTKYVDDKMKHIQENVSKNVEKQNKEIKDQINGFLFKGAKIDEKY